MPPKPSLAPPVSEALVAETPNRAAFALPFAPPEKKGVTDPTREQQHLGSPNSFEHSFYLIGEFLSAIICVCQFFIRPM
jgi:hypothetical protein